MEGWSYVRRETYDEGRAAMLNTIDTYLQLRELEERGLVRAKPHEREGKALVLYNYTGKMQLSSPDLWDAVSRACRGLVLKMDHFHLEYPYETNINFKTHTNPGPIVVARPLAKFFNVGETHSSIPKGEDFVVLEKVDGSLGIVFYCPEVSTQPHGWVCITRGSWDGPQALRGTQLLSSTWNTAALDRNFTYCVEIVSPEFRVVVDYGAVSELVLLAAIRKTDGFEMSWTDLQTTVSSLNLSKAQVVRLPRVVLTSVSDDSGSPANLEAFLKQVAETPGLAGTSAEGFVVHFASGLRLKHKYKAYKALHAAATNVTDAAIHDAWTTDDFEPLCSLIADSVEVLARQKVTEWEEALCSAEQRVRHVLAAAPPKHSRDDESLCLSTQHLREILKQRDARTAFFNSTEHAPIKKALFLSDADKTRALRTELVAQFAPRPKPPTRLTKI